MIRVMYFSFFILLLLGVSSPNAFSAPSMDEARFKIRSRNVSNNFNFLDQTGRESAMVTMAELVAGKNIEEKLQIFKEQGPVNRPDIISLDSENFLKADQESILTEEGYQKLYVGVGRTLYVKKGLFDLDKGYERGQIEFKGKNIYWLNLYTKNDGPKIAIIDAINNSDESADLVLEKIKKNEALKFDYMILLDLKLKKTGEFFDRELAEVTLLDDLRNPEESVLYWAGSLSGKKTWISSVQMQKNPFELISEIYFF